MVVLQFGLLLVIFIGFGEPFIETGFVGLIIGGLLLLAGLALGFSAVNSMKQPISVLPSPINGSRLITNGPYKYIRHPMYSSIIMASMGIVIAAPTASRLVALSCLIIVLTIKTKYEETLLGAKFKAYKDHIYYTGRFVPKLKVKK